MVCSLLTRLRWTTLFGFAGKGVSKLIKEQIQKDKGPKKFINPLYGEAEERVVERSDDRVSLLFFMTILFDKL
jgi:hypothetical protein